MQKRRYVAGLLFNDLGDRVALIHKTHGPSSVVGHWNAIGGKRIDQTDLGLGYESPDAAMFREFREEASVEVRSWELFLVLRGRGPDPEWMVHFYHAFDTQALAHVSQGEEEEVIVWDLGELPNIVPNLRWIIPMALGHHDDHVFTYEVIEKDTFMPANGHSSQEEQ